MKKLVSFVLVFALVVPVFVGAQDADRATDAVSLEKRIYGLEVSVRSLQDQVGKILQILSSMTTTRPTISTAPLPSDPTKNLAPIAMADVARTTVGTAVYVNVLANDRDPEGGKLSIVWADTFAPVMTKGGGTITRVNDQMLYTPPARYVGTDQFNYQVTDGALTSTGVVYVLISSSSISADTVDSTAADTVTPTISTNTSALRILSTAPYGRDGERVGMLVDWNDVAGALYYQITSYRQDTAGSASPSTVTTKSQWGTGAHPNAGEEDGYCYYRRVRVNAVNNKGVVFASATAESCYMADEDNEPGKYPPAVTRLSPQVQGASTDANTLHIMNQIESLQKKLNDLLAR